MGQFDAENGENYHFELLLLCLFDIPKLVKSLDWAISPSIINFGPFQKPPASRTSCRFSKPGKTIGNCIIFS
jgi:hypothetical protein